MPLDRGIIEQQLQALGESTRWWEQRELRDLPSVMRAGERITAIARGKIARPRWVHRSRLIVVTDRRLICLRSSTKSSWSQMEVDGALVSRVAMRIGPFRGRVLVTSGGQTWRLLAPRTDAYRLFHALSVFVPAASNAVPGSRPALIVRRVIDHVLALPAVALGPEPKPAPVAAADGAATDETTDRHVELLEEQLQELQRQVDFLEQLLHQQHALPGASRKLPT